MGAGAEGWGGAFMVTFFSLRNACTTMLETLKRGNHLAA